MAIDSRQKRASSVGVVQPWTLQLPLPDGTISQADREQISFRYIGILASALVIGPFVRPYGIVSESSICIGEVT